MRLSGGRHELARRQDIIAARWRKAREGFLKSNPLCAYQADEVDTDDFGADLDIVQEAEL